MSKHPEKLPVVALERIDDICVEFENAWRRGERPEIEAVLDRAASSNERAALLAELLVLDFDYRHKRGEQPSPQEYLQRFPQDTEVVQSALDDRTELAKTSRFVPPTIDELAEFVSRPGDPGSDRIWGNGGGL